MTMRSICRIFYFIFSQVRNINSYIVNARKTACNWYMPKISYRIQYDQCGLDVVSALTLGDGLCKAVGVEPASYCDAAKTAVGACVPCVV